MIIFIKFVNGEFWANEDVVSIDFINNSYHIITEHCEFIFERCNILYFKKDLQD